MSSSPEYTDATLVCEDQREFKVHRVILTACSAVFEKIFSFSSQNNPIVYLRGTDGQEIQSVLQFIYLGQTTVPQQRMTEFLNVAKSLKINGISNEEGSVNSHRLSNQKFHPDSEEGRAFGVEGITDGCCWG